MKYLIGFNAGLILMGWAAVLAGTPPDSPFLGTALCLVAIAICAAVLHAQRSPEGASPHKGVP